MVAGALRVGVQPFADNTITAIRAYMSSVILHKVCPNLFHVESHLGDFGVGIYVTFSSTLKES